MLLKKEIIIKNYNSGGEKNNINDRGSVRPSYDQVKVVTETRRKQQGTLPGI